MKLSPLALFMTAVTAVGLPLFAVSLAALTQLHGSVHPESWRTLAFLTAGLVIGELLPIEIARQGRHSDEITISSTFSVALMLAAPLGLTMIWQAIPLVVDDIRRGKHWSRPLFNVAQYSLTLAAARGAFCLVSGDPMFEPERFGADNLLAAFVGATVFFLVNHGLVGTAVALWSDESILRHLSDDARFQLATSGLLVALAPVVLSVSQFSVALVPVLLLPIIAVRHTAHLALRSESDALCDSLTGLPNRAMLLLELNRTLVATERRNDAFAVMFIDLDHFKDVNDTLGHQAGDLLIREVALRLTGVAGDDVMVARLGGDEFAVLTPLPATRDRSAADVALEVAGRLSASLEEAFDLGGVRLQVRASIGIALAPEHAGTSDEMLAKADIAMYTAKNDGRGRALYDPRQDPNTRERLTLVTELRDGIGRGELVVFYQPKCEVATGRVVGVEALVRWQHPTRGLLAPDEFVPLAERTELIGPLTLAVLEQSIQQGATWLADGRRLSVAVNLSVRHLSDDRLAQQVFDLLDRHSFPAELLTIEVTESIVMNEPGRVAQVLASMRERGISISIDDYGTGYSTLSYLKNLSVDELKIDRSFISTMMGDQNDQIIVRSTIDLAHNLGLRVVAEGVEEMTSWSVLQTLGCDLVQGYVASRPQTAAALNAWFLRWEVHSLVPVPRQAGSGAPERPPEPAPAPAPAPAPIQMVTVR